MRSARVFIAAVLLSFGAFPIGNASAQQVWKWSQTIGNNSIADPSISWVTGMAPSAVSPSARAMMAAVARYRDDISGLLATGGTATAYTVVTNQTLCTSSTAPQDGQALAVTMSATNGASPTFQADGCTAYPIQSSPGIPVASGTMVSGSPYTLKFSNANSAWMLRDFYSNPYQVPLGAMLDYTGTTAPNSNFVIPYGQCISRTVYAAYFAQVGTAFGTCDGTTTFGVPDMRGRVAAGADGMGGVLAGRLNATGGMNGVGIGAVGGAQTHTLTLAELPAGITSSGSNTISVASSVNLILPGGAPLVTVSSPGGGAYGINSVPTPTIGQPTSSGINSINVTSNNTSGSAHTIVPPTLVIYKILRVL